MLLCVWRAAGSVCVGRGGAARLPVSVCAAAAAVCLCAVLCCCVAVVRASEGVETKVRCNCC